MPTRSEVKLGRKAVKTDTRTLKLGPYLKTLPVPPASVDWTKGIANWGMMLNDQLGDCTIAGCGHAVQVWTANVGEEITVPDNEILSYYEKWDGYVDGDSTTDNGGIELDVMKNWRSDGFAGHKLLAFATAETRNLTEVRQAINLFGGVYIGMNVPNSVMNNLDPSVVWEVVQDDGGIDGGHCVFVPKYGPKSFTFISWGQPYIMTKAFWEKYVDEAHALVSDAWVNAKLEDPQGVLMSQLMTDVAAIR